MRKEDIPDTRIKAILIAFETQRKNLESTGFRVKAIWEELSPIQKITTDEVFRQVNSLLKEYDDLKIKFDEYLKDLDDFIQLIHHEFDLVTKPLKEEIRRGEKLMREYRKNIKLINSEINNRYR
jgi:archaellum component FlaC